MPTCVILNPAAGTVAQSAVLLETLAHCPQVALRQTSGAGQASALAAEAVQAGYDLIVAAGGDGTIKEVVNGLAPDFARVTLGVIPLGTGNDLARTLALPLDDTLEAWQTVHTGQVRWLDVLTIAAAEQPVIYGLNMAIGGFTGQMNEVLSTGLKRTWGPLAYLIGATQVLPELTTYETAMVCDEGPLEHLQVLNVAVANGRTAAGGYQVAPVANPEDGWLDLVVIRAGSLLDLAAVAARFVAGTWLDSEQVLHRRVRRVQLASRPDMAFNVDGEFLTAKPLTLGLRPQALRVVVGPAYTPDPASPLVA